MKKIAGLFLTSVMLTGALAGCGADTAAAQTAATDNGRQKFGERKNSWDSR